MIELNSFSEIFHLEETKIRAWSKLLRLCIDKNRVENIACEKLVLMRYLIDKMGEVEALSLTNTVFDDLNASMPVFSIVNDRFLVVGSDDTRYDMKTGCKTEEIIETVYTSFAVNVEAFASAIVSFSVSLSENPRESSEHQAPGAGAQHSEEACLE